MVFKKLWVKVKAKIFMLLSALLLISISLAGCGGREPNVADMPPVSADTSSGDTEGSLDETDTSSGDADGSFGDTKAEEEDGVLAESGIDEEEDASPGEVLFQDDTGKNLQRDGDHLFCYHDGRLMRYSKDASEAVLLYQTGTGHQLHFCLYQDDVYFVDRTTASSLEGRETMLYRVGKDGKNLTLLQDHILNIAYLEEDTDNFYTREHLIGGGTYDIDIYDDIIYLLYNCYSYSEDGGGYVPCNLYFQIREDGSVAEIDEAGTLYGRLPAGFSGAGHSSIPSLPYAMRNYGCVFVKDSQDILYRLDMETGERQSLQVNVNDYEFTFSRDQALMKSYGSGLALLDLSDASITPIKTDPQSSYFYSFIPSLDSPGFMGYEKKYGDSDDSSYYVVYHIAPDGSITTLVPKLELDAEDPYMHSTYFTEENLYYYDAATEDIRLMRLPVEENSRPEMLDSWPVFAATSPAELITEELGDEMVIEDYFSLSYSLDKMLLAEKSDADIQINKKLSEVYGDFYGWIEDEKDSAMEEAESYKDWYADYDQTASTEFSLSVACDYMDDDMISFCFSYYQYYAGAAHGYYWSDFYVFDRDSGEQLTLEDLTHMSADSIIQTVRPYVELVAGNENLFDSEYFPPDVLLEPKRFSLSDDGYTLYFAPYEIASYAEGAFLIVIPFEAFGEGS